MRKFNGNAYTHTKMYVNARANAFMYIKNLYVYQIAYFQKNSVLYEIALYVHVIYIFVIVYTSKPHTNIIFMYNT